MDLSKVKISVDLNKYVTAMKKVRSSSSSPQPLSSFDNVQFKEPSISIGEKRKRSETEDLDFGEYVIPLATEKPFKGKEVTYSICKNSNPEQGKGVPGVKKNLPKSSSEVTGNSKHLFSTNFTIDRVT
ncbi:hypothetical protein FRX31_016755, partial [Thalictrum thalictroides]